jgi:cytochrome c553
VCESCHGIEGRSTLPDTPSLAGQPKQFITTQLVMFREGNRKNAIMNPIAAPLSNAEISELGSYFSAQRPSPRASRSPPARQRRRAALAERLGCVTCHGAELKGQQHIPRLAGQQADYLRTQLLGFKAGTRFDMDGNMTAAAQALTPAAIDALGKTTSARCAEPRAKERARRARQASHSEGAVGRRVRKSVPRVHEGDASPASSSRYDAEQRQPGRQTCARHQRLGVEKP